MRDYIAALERRGRNAEVASILRHIDLLKEAGVTLGMPYARMIHPAARLYELRPGNHRIAYRMANDDCIMLHAWRKTSQALDARASALALKRLAVARSSK